MCTHNRLQAHAIRAACVKRFRLLNPEIGEAVRTLDSDFMAIGEMGDAYGVPEVVAAMQSRIVVNQPTTVAPRDRKSVVSSR